MLQLQEVHRMELVEAEAIQASTHKEMNELRVRLAKESDRAQTATISAESWEQAEVQASNAGLRRQKILGMELVEAEMAHASGHAEINEMRARVGQERARFRAD